MAVGVAITLLLMHEQMILFNIAYLLAKICVALFETKKSPTGSSGSEISSYMHSTSTYPPSHTSEDYCSRNTDTSTIEYIKISICMSSHIFPDTIENIH